MRAHWYSGGLNGKKGSRIWILGTCKLSNKAKRKKIDKIPYFIFLYLVICKVQQNLPLLKIHINVLMHYKMRVVLVNILFASSHESKKEPDSTQLTI